MFSKTVSVATTLAFAAFAFPTSSSAQTITEIPTPSVTTTTIDMDNVGPVGPTTLAAIVAAAAPTPAQIANIVLSPSTAAAGVYDTFPNCIRALALGSSPLVLIDSPTGTFTAFNARIDFQAPMTQFGIGIGDWAGPMILEFYIGGKLSTTFTTSAYTDCPRKFFRMNGGRFDRVDVRASTTAGNWVITELEVERATGLRPNFTSSTFAGNSPLTVQFTDLSFSSNPGGITAWEWDFDGNGTIDSRVQNPTHTYAACGRYTVALRVTDGAGNATETRANWIDVDQVAASFTATPTAGCGSLTVTFTDTSTGNPTAWEWDFDNNGTVDSTARHPTHTYTGTGTFSPKLTVRGPCNASTVVRQNLIALSNRLSTLFARNNNGNVGGALYFQVTVTSGTPLSFSGIESNHGAAAGSPVGVEVYVTAQGSSYSGNEANMAAWTRVATGSGTTAGLNQPTLHTFAAPFTLTPGTYGMCLVAIGDSHHYTNGTGANQAYSNADLSLALGSASNVPFTGTPFTPRVWNGSLLYCTACRGTVSNAGTGCADHTGTRLAMRVTGCPDRGTTMNVNLRTGAANNLPVFFITGVSDTLLGGLIVLPLDLTPFGATGCSAYTSQELVLGPFGNAGGGAGFSSLVPNQPFLVGGRLYTQGWQIIPGVNPLNVVSSDYVTIIIG